MKRLPTSSSPSSQNAPPRLFSVGGSRGIVVHHNVAWKTSVTSGGGGGYLEKGTGFICPTWTRTDHVHWQEFWIKTNDGHESHYWLQGYEQINLREGQEVGVLLINGTVTYLMNYTTGMISAIAPLDRLLPLRSPMNGCAITAFTLFVAPCLGFVLMLAIAFVIGLIVRATVGIIPSDQAPAWLTTFAAWLGTVCILTAMVGSIIYLTRQSRRVEAENNSLRTQGRLELDDACQRCLGVHPTN